MIHGSGRGIPCPTERPGILQAFLGAITRNLSLDRYRKNHSKKRGEGEISYIYEEMQDCISGENMELHVENMELAEMINRFLAGMKTENPQDLCAEVLVF